MWRAFYIFALLGILSGAFVWGAADLVHRLAPERDRPDIRRWLWPWSVKGLGVPLALWIVMNLGVSWNLQPFMPQVQVAQYRSGSWFPVFLTVTASGLFAICSYWAAVTLGWALARQGIGLKDEVRSEFKTLCLVSLLAVFLPALLIFALGGWMTLGVAATFLLLPIAGYAPGVLHGKKAPPMYARAVGKMKFGKYSEAEWEILRELERCEDDFEGWMMLAELYATQFNDVAGAGRTILEICAQPEATPSEISVALHRLADWHLNLRDDPAAAGRALQIICDRLPDTHLARMAQLRLSQLPRVAAELRERRTPRTFALPALSESFEEGSAPTGAAPDAGRAAALANQLTAQLTRDSNDAETRERLARVFAEQLAKADLAIEQLELLLGLAGQPDSKRAEWLSLIAAWQLRLKHDPDAARQTMQRLIREFPQSPQAFAAQRRLNLMDAELRMQRARAAVAKMKFTPPAIHSD